MADQVLDVITFSYKRNEDMQIDSSYKIIDCRILHNPFWFVQKTPELKELDGSDKRIQNLIMNGDREAFDALFNHVRKLYQSGVRKFAFGCTGGKHRSVCMACMIKEL